MSEQPWVGVFQCGETVGEYHIQEVLGEGGMGVVYRANHPAFHQDVAIKVLPRARSASRTFRDRFEKEAEALKRLNHKNIVAIIDKGTKDDNHYFVMECLPGHTLEEVLQRGPMKVKHAFRLMLQLVDAAQYAHERGTIHRDLKPSNVILDDLGDPKIADFGIAQSMIHAEGTRMRADEQVGTAEYAAPEQLTDATRVDQRTDIYALGAVLYEMLTGLPPVGRLKSVHKMAPRAHPKVDEVIRKAMSPEMSDRYESAEAFGKALRMAQGLPEETEKSETPWRKISIAAGIAAATLGLIWMAVAAGRRAPTTPERPSPDPPQAVKEPPRASPPVARRTRTPATVPTPAPKTPAKPPQTAPRPSPSPEALAARALARARKYVSARNYKAAIGVLTGKELATSKAAKALLAKARAGERSRLVASAKRSIGRKRWDHAVRDVTAAAKFGGGADLTALKAEIAEGRRAALIEHAKAVMAKDPDKAAADLQAAGKIRKDKDIKLLHSRVSHHRRLAEEKQELAQKYAARMKQGDKAAADKNTKMARQWYEMARQIKDTPEVRRKLAALGKE